MEVEGSTGPKGTRVGVTCVLCALALMTVAGVIIFPIGYNIAYLEYPLPAYGAWRRNQAVVEDTLFGTKALAATAVSPAVAAGECAVKLWFVIYHSANGALQRPKRIAAWTNVAPPTDAVKCKSLQTKNVYIYYDTANPTTVKSQHKFKVMKELYEDNHKYGSHLFWLGTTFLSCVLIPLVLWLAALVFQGLRHINSSGAGTASRTQYDKVSSYQP